MGVQKELRQINGNIYANQNGYGQKKIAVIGAGPSGLIAMKKLKENDYNIVGFEKNFNVGGLWNYTDKTGMDDYGLPVHSSMYKTLKTNQPIEAMSIPGFSWPKEWPSFISHEQVLQYLESYCERFDLLKDIKLHTMVTDVSPIEKTRWTKWRVQYCDIRKQWEKHVEEFDVVLVCIGHHAVPLMPDLPGIDQFKGTVIHSHDYRKRERFIGQKVAVLGASFSGQDIALQVSTVAEKVFLCHRNKKRVADKFPDNIIQRPAIVSVKQNSVVLSDKTEEKVDSIIFCTGYKYGFPFFKEEVLRIENERITPLYKHLVHTRHVSLMFIGVPRCLAYFSQFDGQVEFVLRVLDGTLTLPSTKEMDEDSEEEYQQRLKSGLTPKYAHFMGIARQWKYNREIAEMAGFDPIPRAVQKLNDHVTHVRSGSTKYHQTNYIITGPDTFALKE